MEWFLTGSKDCKLISRQTDLSRIRKSDNVQRDKEREGKKKKKIGHCTNIKLDRTREDKDASQA